MCTYVHIMRYIGRVYVDTLGVVCMYDDIGRVGGSV